MAQYRKAISTMPIRCDSCGEIIPSETTYYVREYFFGDRMTYDDICKNCYELEKKEGLI